jgi:metal-dependent hydrolase (beta-lactamase superfamily II)
MDRVRRTVAEIAKLAPELVALGHCTGKEAERLLGEAFGERFAALRGGRTWDL